MPSLTRTLALIKGALFVRGGPLRVVRRRVRLPSFRRRTLKSRLLLGESRERLQVAILRCDNNLRHHHLGESPGDGNCDTRLSKQTRIERQGTQQGHFGLEPS